MTEHRHAAGPHDFAPLARRDALHANGRCKHCYLLRAEHPALAWTPARPLRDTTGEDPYISWLWRAVGYIVLILVVWALLRLIVFIT